MNSQAVSALAQDLRVGAVEQCDTKTTAELRAMSDEQLQARFLQVRMYLNRNNLVPAQYRATADPVTRARERRYVSESSRIIAIAFQRQLALRYPTREELQARSLFK